MQCWTIRKSYGNIQKEKDIVGKLTMSLVIPVGNNVLRETLICKSTIFLKAVFLLPLL